jgi:hypothetical protein
LLVFRFFFGFLSMCLCCGFFFSPCK